MQPKFEIMGTLHRKKQVLKKGDYFSNVLVVVQGSLIMGGFGCLASMMTG